MALIYDETLFAALNEEWRERPRLRSEQVEHWAHPIRRRVRRPSVDADNPALVRAARRLPQALVDVEMDGAEVLDLGCGEGWNSTVLLDHGGARSVIGLDVREYLSWDGLRRPGRLDLRCGDLSDDDGLLADDSIDVVYSTVVFEHIRRPLQMLRSLRRVLRQGGKAWLRINLHPGISASHAYRRVFFPWPHLLFDASVARSVTGGGYAWVNHMTVAQYVQAAVEAGFQITALRRDVVDIDVPFYLRFEERLGRYAAFDLETNFVNLVLTATDAGGDVPRLNYIERQVALDAAIRAA